jgi:hypothetical protein
LFENLSVSKIIFTLAMTLDKRQFREEICIVNPCEHIKKVPPRHQRHNCGFTLNVVHRKLKAVGISIISA